MDARGEEKGSRLRDRFLARPIAATLQNSVLDPRIFVLATGGTNEMETIRFGVLGAAAIAPSALLLSLIHI